MVKFWNEAHPWPRREAAVRFIIEERAEELARAGMGSNAATKRRTMAVLSAPAKQWDNGGEAGISRLMSDIEQCVEQYWTIWGNVMNHADKNLSNNIKEYFEQCYKQFQAILIECCAKYQTIFTNILDNNENNTSDNILNNIKQFFRISNFIGKNIVLVNHQPPLRL